MAGKSERELRANRREEIDKATVKGEQTVCAPKKEGPSEKKGSGEFSKYGSVGHKRLLQNEIGRNENSVSSGGGNQGVSHKKRIVKKKGSVGPKRLQATVYSIQILTLLVLRDMTLRRQKEKDRSDGCMIHCVMKTLTVCSWTTV